MARSNRSFIPQNDRERLGAVNLRADEELTELETKYNIAGERDDLVEAIKRLRQAVAASTARAASVCLPLSMS